MKHPVFLMLLIIGFACQSTVSNPQRIQSYIKQLNDKDDQIRQNAHVNLVTIGKPAALELALALDEAEKPLRMSIVQILEQIGPSEASIPALIKTLRQPNFILPSQSHFLDYYTQVAMALAQIGPPAIPALAEVLSDEPNHKAVRDYTVLALDFILDNQNFLDQMPQTQRRLSAQEAVPTLQEAVPTLIRLLNDTDDEIRATAAGVLGYIGQSEIDATPVLIPMLSDESSQVRAAAAGALGTIGSHAVTIPALRTALTDKHEAPRVKAAIALGAIGPPAHEAVPQLINLLDTGTDSLQVAIIIGLGGIRTPLAINTVIAALNDYSFTVRRTAIDQLGRIRTPIAIQALFNTLADEDPNLRLLGVVELGRIGEPAVPTLIAGLSEKRDVVRKESAFALQHIGGAAIEAVPALAQASKDKNRQVRLAAARALKSIGTPEAQKVVENFTEFPPPPPKVKVDN